MNIRKANNPISIKKVRKVVNPSKLKKMKITEEIPIPIGKERLIRSLNSIVLVSLKIRRQDTKPSKRGINIEKNNII
ncbi:MAG: hypothetical protein V4547_15105 [Bacteroidota bacterium]